MTNTIDDLRTEVAAAIVARRYPSDDAALHMHGQPSLNAAERILAIPYLADAVKLKIDHDKLMLGPSVGTR